MNINAIEEISKAFLFKLNDMSSSKMPPLIILMHMRLVKNLGLRNSN